MNQDPHITESIYRIADYNIRQCIIALFEQIQHKNTDQQRKISQVFNYFIKKSSTIGSRMEQIVSILYYNYWAQLESVYPELSNPQKSSIAKKGTTTIIKEIIKEELEKRQISEKRQDIEAKSVMDISLHIVDRKQSHQNIHLQSISQSYCHSLFHQQPFQPEQEIQGKIELYNSPQFQIADSSVKQRPSLTSPNQSSDFCLNSKQKLSKMTLISAKQQELLQYHNILEKSNKLGHFLYGDKPNQIVQLFSKDKQIYAVMSWKPREDNNLPQPSSLTVKEVRLYAPLLLCEYYEHFLETNERKNSQYTTYKS